MLGDFFLNSGIFSDVNIREGLSYVKISARVISDIRSVILDAVKELQVIDARDDFELLIDVDGESTSFVRDSATDTEGFLSMLKRSSEAEDVTLSLIINKRVVDEQLSVYFFDKLTEYFSETTCSEILKSIASVFHGRLKFQVYQSIESFHTETISFSSAGDAIALRSIDGRERILESFRDNSSLLGTPSGFIPSDFNLIKRAKFSAINEFFDNACGIFALAFLANSSELKDNDRFSYKLYGYKAIICKDESIKSISAFSKLLNQIYTWAYESGSVSDKLGLIRNVLSIHVDDSGSLRIDNPAWEAIQSNYQIYLRGNIQSYLEVKNKLGELLFDSVSKTAVLADELLNSLKNNTAVVVTFLLTVVVVNGVKDLSVAAIFSNAYLYIVISLIIFSFVWMAAIRNDVIGRYESGSQAMVEVLNNSYDKLLMKSEIDASIAPTLTRNNTFLAKQITKYCQWWAVMNILFFLVFLVGNHLFAQPSIWIASSSSKVDAPSAQSLVRPSIAKNSNAQVPSSSAKLPITTGPTSAGRERKPSPK